MANKKISELSAVTTLAGTDVLPVVVGGGTTNKVTFQNFLRNAPDGTAAAPSIANVGDQDTGILFPATNSVAVSTGGTQRFVVNGNGNVGIGEGSPLTPLHVSSTGDTVVRITSADGNGAFLDLGDASDPDGGRIVYDSGSNLTFSTASTERVRIDSSGNFGIGASLPAAKLDVAGNQIFTAANPQIQFNAGGPIIRLPSANTLAFLTDSTNERLRLDSSGNLSIGSTSPQARLEVRQDSSTAYDSSEDSAQRDGTSSICITNHNNSTNSFSQLVFDTAGSDQSIARIVAIRTGTSSNDLAFVVEGSNTKREAMRIGSDGRVMIGTTTNNGGALTVDAGGSSNVAIRDNAIENHKTNGNGSIAINYSGYANGTTQFRDFVIYNGKQQHVATFEGSSGNVLLGGTASPASATKSLAIFNGTAPTGSVTDGVVLYAEDVSSSSELKVRDEAGNVTTLSPHNFDLIPEGPSEDMAWSYYSEKDGKRINVDMLKAVRLLEQLTGEQLVFTG